MMFIDLWLHWLFIIVHRLSLVVAIGGYSLLLSCRLLIAVASLVEHRLEGVWASVVGIFPDQECNPCPLHWQADS